MSSIEYQCIEGLPEPRVIGGLAQLNQEIFGFNETEEILTQLFEEQSTVLICLAVREGLTVGYKIGFGESRGSLESWRGGVAETARQQGIARTLMQMQHRWCEERGYRVIKTTTNGDNGPMLSLNLQSGFQIVGTFVNRRGRLKVLQEKRLSPRDQASSLVSS